MKKSQQATSKSRKPRAPVRKKLPIGISDFKTVIDEGYYYVDKTLLIRDIIDSGAQTSLIVRPRRFGKTINLSMLRYFFEVPTPPNKKLDRLNSAHLFKNLQIWAQGVSYTQHCSQYPVIYLTLKDAKESDWDKCFKSLKKTISSEYGRHQYLLKSSQLSAFEKKEFEAIIELKADEVSFKNALKSLSELLYRYYDKKVLVLIDEYDTPVHEAYNNGYYEKIIDFLRTFMGSVLKDNSSLYKGVITGILRVAKENIFSDLNNMNILSLLNFQCSDKFGLLEFEVKELLSYYKVGIDFDEVKRWYNGYRFGDTANIYNPWSILNFTEHNKEGLRPYWVNTSGNKLIGGLLAQSDESTKKDLERLLQGESILKHIHIDTVFSDIPKDGEHLWSFLLFAGYLKIIKQHNDLENELVCELKIPNLEVHNVYRKFVKTWLSENLSGTDISILLKSLVSGDFETFELILQKFVINSMSYFDPAGTEPEKVYHAFVLGLLVQLSSNYLVKSNIESGYGRYDISLIPHQKSKPGIIIEFKKVIENKKETLSSAAQSALAQIESRKYETELRTLGMQNIFKLGIAFKGKKILVLAGKQGKKHGKKRSPSYD